LFFHVHHICLAVPAGKWTVQQAAELSVAAPTITSSLDGRYMSALKDQRVAASKVFGELGLKVGQGLYLLFACGVGVLR
jgi:6-phosphogluconate dehydrogenase